MPAHIIIVGLPTSAMAKIDRAIENHNKAIELKPNYASAYNNRGAA